MAYGGSVEANRAEGVTEALAALATMDVPGLIRRVRRVVDLSQRELGRLLGVSKATVGRWETGQAEPRLSHLTVVFGLMGARLCALDERNREVWAMPGSREDDDTPRDHADRLYPAHLDLEPDLEALNIWRDKPRPGRQPRRLSFHHRRHRDEVRARRGTPSTQPTKRELLDWMEAVWLWRRYRAAFGHPRDRPIPAGFRPEGLRLLSSWALPPSSGSHEDATPSRRPG